MIAVHRVFEKPTRRHVVLIENFGQIDRFRSVEGAIVQIENDDVPRLHRRRRDMNDFLIRRFFIAAAINDFARVSLAI